MTIATGDGQVFKDRFDQLSAPYRPAQEGSGDLSSGQGADVNYDHHVPLVASALMDGSGGIAIDSRLKGMFNKKEEDLLKYHEGLELGYMRNKMIAGATAPEAYAEGHEWATKGETAASIAQWGEEGHEKYKDKIRQAVAIAKEPSDKERCPNCHTSMLDLDHYELGYPKIAGPVTDAIKEWLFGSEKEEGLKEGKTYSPRMPMDMPTEEEAQFARKGELSYGSPHASFEEGERGRFIKAGPIQGEPGTPKQLEMLRKTPTIDINEKYRQSAADFYTRAQLVANRSPLTALGFDPRRFSGELDKSEGLSRSGVIGYYAKDKDLGWASDTASDTLAHESTHRGLHLLEQRGWLTDKEKKFVDNFNLNEESVRYLMNKYASDDPALQQKSNLSEESIKVLEGIEKKAADLYHELYGKGPH